MYKSNGPVQRALTLPRGPRQHTVKNCEPSRARKMGTKKCEKYSKMLRTWPPTSIGQFPAPNVLSLQVSELWRPLSHHSRTQTVQRSIRVPKRVAIECVAVESHRWRPQSHYSRTLATGHFLDPNVFNERQRHGVLGQLTRKPEHDTVKIILPQSLAVNVAKSSTRPMFDSPATSTMLLFT